MEPDDKQVGRGKEQEQQLEQQRVENEKINDTNLKIDSSTPPPPQQPLKITTTTATTTPTSLSPSSALTRKKSTTQTTTTNCGDIKNINSSISNNATNCNSSQPAASELSSASDFNSHNENGVDPSPPPPFESIRTKIRRNSLPNAQSIRDHIDNLISQNEAIIDNWNLVSIRSYNSSRLDVSPASPQTLSTINSKRQTTSTTIAPHAVDLKNRDCASTSCINANNTNETTTAPTASISALRTRPIATPRKRWSTTAITGYYGDRPGVSNIMPVHRGTTLGEPTLPIDNGTRNCLPKESQNSLIGLQQLGLLAAYDAQQAALRQHQRTIEQQMDQIRISQLAASIERERLMALASTVSPILLQNQYHQAPTDISALRDIERHQVGNYNGNHIHFQRQQQQQQPEQQQLPISLVVAHNGEVSSSTVSPLNMVAPVPLQMPMDRRLDELSMLKRQLLLNGSNSWPSFKSSPNESGSEKPISLVHDNSNDSSSKTNCTTNGETSTGNKSTTINGHGTLPFKKRKVSEPNMRY